MGILDRFSEKAGTSIRKMVEKQRESELREEEIRRITAKFRGRLDADEKNRSESQGELFLGTFFRKDIISVPAIILFSLILAFLPQQNSLFLTIILWFYQASVILFVFSYIYTKFIRRKRLSDDSRWYRAAYNPSLRITGKWVAFGYGAGLFFLVAFTEYLGVINFACHYLTIELCRLFANFIIFVVPLVIIPLIFLVRIYRQEKKRPGAFITLLLDGIGYLGTIFGLVFMLLLVFSYVVVVLLGIIGIKFV